MAKLEGSDGGLWLHDPPDFRSAGPGRRPLMETILLVNDEADVRATAKS